MKNILERLKEEVLLCDGAMGTQLISRGVPMDACREEINLTNPSLILSIHEDYVRAGAQIIETNTFGANYIQLRKYGLEKKLKQINQEAVRLAKDIASRWDVYVAGSVGPLGAMLKPYGPLTIKNVNAFYTDQISYLIEAGVDLIIIETISDLLEAKEAIKVAKSIANIPVICQLTFMADGKTKLGYEAKDSLIELAETGADVVGLNCSVGPRETYEILSDIINDLSCYVSVQPNAGYPSLYKGKLIYFAGPGYLQEYAKLYAELGANIIGSCCGTDPSHTKAMAEAIKGYKPHRKIRENPPKTEIVVPKEQIQIKEKKKPTKLTEYLKKDFVMTVEIDPPKGINYSKLIIESHHLKEMGIDLVNIADNPMARVRMSSMVMAHIIKDEVGLEPILHFTCRDRNILGIQSELLGASALNINVILALRGDPANVGDFPKATSVFDVDSLGLIKIINSLNNGFNFSGVPIDSKTNFIVGIAGNPNSIDLDTDIRRIEEKIQAGASFIQTQPIYEIDKLIKFKERIKNFDVDLIIGILPLVSYKQAAYLHHEVPGIIIPEYILKLLEKLSPEAAEKEGIKIVREFIREAKPYINGFYFIPPFERYSLIEKILA